jgi:hypothetical protein
MHIHMADISQKVISLQLKGNTLAEWQLLVSLATCSEALRWILTPLPTKVSGGLNTYSYPWRFSVHIPLMLSGNIYWNCMKSTNSGPFASYTNWHMHFNCISQRAMEVRSAAAPVVTGKDQCSVCYEWKKWLTRIMRACFRSYCSQNIILYYLWNCISLYELHRMCYKY